MNKEHVEFALKRWAEARGWYDISTYNDLSSEPFGVKYKRDGLTRWGYFCPPIDHTFCRDLPIKDEFSYFFALAEVLGITGMMGEWDYYEYKAIHNATIDQRLAAYYKAEHE